MFDPYSSNNNKKKQNIMSISNINEIKKIKHQKIIISNLEILFPYSPHESQILFMKKIINNLNQKFMLQNNYKAFCALESPSGTKKTLCILCACLAWINDMKRTNSYKGKIIYVVKNYKKLSKIIKTLNEIYYKPKICVLFSLNESCINDEINKAKNNDIIFFNCRNSRENCEFYKNMKKKKNIEKREEYLSIEELNNYICENRICPFLYEKNKVNNSDIIFITYENFFDKTLKNIYGYEINNNILIFDKGETLDKICENFESISISVLDLEDIKKILFEFIGDKNIENIINNNEESNINIDDIKSEILSIDRIISNLNVTKQKIIEGEVYPNKGLILQNKEFLSLFLTKNNNNIDDMQYITLDNIKKHIISLLNTEKLINIFFTKNSKIPLLASILEKIYNFYLKQKENLIDSYTFFLSIEKNEENIENIKLNIYCFDPSISFQNFIINEKPFASFLCSDYFGPFDLLENEFKLRFDIKLQNDSIFQNDNFQLNIIQSTLYKEEKIEFLLDEINSNNIKMKLAIGYTLLSLCYSNPKGSILVFFPSMAYLYQCNLLWKENNIIESISKIKKVKYLIENENNIYEKETKHKNYIYFTEFDSNNSFNKIKERKNAKISMVIILGFPQEKEYNYKDKIQLKMNYIDNKKNRILNNRRNISYSDDFNLDEISGEKWYQKNIMTPINIFLGKALKLMGGFGSIICIDNRYIDTLNNGCFYSFLRNKAEIINIENRLYFDDLLSFYQKIENKKNNILNINEEKPSNNLNIINDNININEPEETENFFMNKMNMTKLFYIQNEKNIEMTNNDTIPKNKINIINNDMNLELLNKKQKRINQEKEKNEINKNKKRKINEVYDSNIMLNDICDEYDQIERNNEDNNNENNEETEYELDQELLEQLNKNDFTEECNDIFECPICFKQSKDNPDLIYSRAKCKHVLCNICWCSWFSEKFECPLCKAKARPKTLKRIIFLQ